MGMTNDGTLAYDHQKDGTTQQLAGCLRDFRNKPFPVRARITYYQNTLTVNLISIWIMIILYIIKSFWVSLGVVILSLYLR